MIDKRFNYFVELVLESEGYLSNDKFDKGGLTKYGISQKSYPSLDIENLSLEQAKEIYYEDFYKAFNFDRVDNDYIAFELFDCAVNMGGRTAIKLLQMTLNFVKKLDLEVDGIFGNNTLNTLNNMYDDDIFYMFLIFKSKRYFDIVAKDENQDKFLMGWILKRVINNLKRIK